MVGTYSLRAWSALACLFFTLATRVTHAEEKISEEAKLYFQNGVELIQNQPPNYQDAYYQFKLAWDRSHSWKVLGNWGLCALKLERDGEAIWAYSEYLKKGARTSMLRNAKTSSATSYCSTETPLPSR